MVAGDSAGAGLALLLQLARRDRGLPQADAALLISPWLDLASTLASCRANDAYDYMQSTVVERHARDFAGSLPLTDPRVSPRYADLTGVAPFIVQAGSAERLVDEAREIVARAREAGVDASLDLVHEMPHNPPALADFHPECRHATERLQRYLREKLA